MTTVDTPGRVVASHAAYDPDAGCEGMLRAWSEDGAWALTTCDRCGVEVGFRRGREPRGSDSDRSEW